MNLQADLRQLLHDIAQNPACAADRLEEMGRRLLYLAGELRRTSGTHDTPGIGDRVTMQLIGPNGEVKHTTGG